MGSADEPPATSGRLDPRQAALREAYRARRMPSYHLFIPLAAMVLIPMSRHALKNAPIPQRAKHGVFLGLTFGALGHAGYVMATEFSPR